MLKSEELINKVKNYNKFLNPETLSKAYDFALKAHEKQKRDEGSPYIIHPIAVANILTELKLDSATICLLYTSPSPRDLSTSRMPSSA